MIKDIREINFPSYATLGSATVTINDMGDRNISAQVMIDGSVVPDFSYDWEVEFQEERYIHPVRNPQGHKDNSSRKAKVDLVFQHWAIYEMKRHYFVEMASTSAGTAVADKYIASLGLNLGDFVVAFNAVLEHYFGGSIVMRLNPDWQYDAESRLVSISYSYVWDVLQQIYEIYGVRWTLKTNGDGVCEILMGYPAEEVSHIFEYGFEGGLLSVQRQVQSTDIRNRLLGRGGSKNLPLRYFKDKDESNPLFEADPDWIPELANISFTELRGKTFRDYVKGWKAKNYGGTAMEDPTEAYLAGYNAEKFDPIEYVEDSESIAKYGELIGSLENNEEIYPSIQGAAGNVDTVVDVEQVVDDDVDSSVENDSVTTNVESVYQSQRVPANSTVTIETQIKRFFSVPTGKVGNLDMSITVTGINIYGSYQETSPILNHFNISIRNENGTEIANSSTAPVINIPTGDYYYVVSANVSSNYDDESRITLDVESVYLYSSTPGVDSGWKPTFDIWVRNIWGSSRNSGETDAQYADRVWGPILGDRTGGDARVVFASGWLSFSSDWEFPIVGYAYDDSKTDSHWRLTLAKSEAELESIGKYIPHEEYNASAGDRFFFIGIDMPHQYVLWAEERLDGYKRDALLQTAEINPTWVIKTDKVRLNQDRNGDKLIDSLKAGTQIRLANSQFISGAYESLYVQSVTYNWTADTKMYPDVELVVSDKVVSVKNPVAQIQGDINTLQQQVGNLSNIHQIIRQVCDQLYLRKDGVEDTSKSPTKFLGKITGEKFRQGQVDGRDWGIYRNESGKSVAEFDQLIIRDIIKVAELEVNQVTYMGGTRVMSQASMECTAVENTDDEYICYFDQKQGSKVNLFTVGDIVWSQDYNADNITLKYYKSVVSAVGDNSIVLDKDQYDGEGVPAVGDILVQAGHISDSDRQSIIIIDTNGNPSITLYRGVNSFVLPDPETRLQSGNNILTGRVHFEAGSSGLENLDLRIGAYNLLRNSGFTGDYLSETLTDEAVLDAVSEMYSSPLDHWIVNTGGIVTIIDPLGIAVSGRGATISTGSSLSQNLYYNSIINENYVFSFKATSLAVDTTTTLVLNCGGVRSEVSVEYGWKDYAISFVVTTPSNEFNISTAEGISVCDLQLERGTMASSWGSSWLDNSSDRAYWQSMKYLQSAIAEGYTEINGGLILTNHIQVGNTADGEIKDNTPTGGMNGLQYDGDDSVFLWGGGTITEAQAAVNKYKADPSYQPTDAELAEMAKFVVTHGGRAILNDMILRGYVYALGGKFQGEIDVNAKNVNGRVVINDNGFVYYGTDAESEYPRVALGSTCQSASGVFLAPNADAGFCTNAALLAVGTDTHYAINAKGDVTVSGDLHANGGVYTDRVSGSGTPLYLGDAEGVYPINIPNGKVGGLRTTTKVITSTGTKEISNYDFSILVNLTSGSVTLTFPSEPIDGQEYIVETKGADITISSAKNIYNHYNGNILSGSITDKGVIRFKYYEEAIQWTMTWLELHQ